MARSMKRTGRFLTWAMALALAVVSSATCVLGAEMTLAQKACCTAMDHDCGAMAVEQDCCVADSPSLVGLKSAPPISVLAPPALVMVNCIAPEPEPTASFFASAVLDAGAPKPSSSPTYLFVSVFRL